MSEIVQMLRYLKADGSVLPPVCEGWTGADIERRRLDEVHLCLRCGGRAQMAFVAETDIGDRWLDLCHRCTHEVRQVLDRPEYQPPWTPEQWTHEPPSD